MEYSTGVARHMLSVLECRGQCVETMGNFTRDTEDYFLMSYFRYLHVGYFKCEYCYCQSVYCVYCVLCVLCTLRLVSLQ